MLEIEIKSSSVPSTANDKPHRINAPSGWGRLLKNTEKGGRLFEV